MFTSIALDPFFRGALAPASAAGHVEETAVSYVVELDMPGVKKEDLKISVEGRELLVTGERKGRVSATVRKRYSLPDDVDADKIEAELKDGVLAILLPKTESVKPKLIPIKA